MKVMIEVDIPQEKINDLIITALEGGSNYWYILPESTMDVLDEVMETEGTDPASVRFCKAIELGKTLEVNDAEDPDTVLGSISTESIQKGLQTMAQKNLEHFMQMFTDGWDADTADVAFQYFVMNDLVFG